MENGNETAVDKLVLTGGEGLVDWSSGGPADGLLVGVSGASQPWGDQF